MTERCIHGITLAVWCGDCEAGGVYLPDEPTSDTRAGWIPVLAVLALTLAAVAWRLLR